MPPDGLGSTLDLIHGFHSDRGLTAKSGGCGATIKTMCGGLWKSFPAR